MDITNIDDHRAADNRGQLDDRLFEKRLLTEREVSEMTGRSRSALQKDRFYRQGIPFVKMGRSVRYLLNDVLSFVDDQRVKTDPTM
jgi:hypothetical protein